MVICRASGMENAGEETKPFLGTHGEERLMGYDMNYFLNKILIFPTHVNLYLKYLYNFICSNSFFFQSKVTI